MPFIPILRVWNCVATVGNAFFGALSADSAFFYILGGLMKKLLIALLTLISSFSVVFTACKNEDTTNNGNSVNSSTTSSSESNTDKILNNPTQKYVIQCLEKVPGILEIEAVTEDTDPMNNLNKPGWYTAHIYFSYQLVNQEDVYGDDLIDKGTDAGGSIEVYKTKSDATERNEYLSAFDGGVLSSGSHTVVGTCVVRTSNELTATQQKLLENNIIYALKGETDKIVKPNSSSNNNNGSENIPPELTEAELLLLAKQIAEESHLSKNETIVALIQQGYSSTKAENIVANCTINWNLQAMKRAESFIAYYDTVSPAIITDLLSDCEFTNSQVDYAINNSEIDWNNQALMYLEYINKMGSLYRTKKDYISTLENNDFSSDNIQYALENCDINWFEVAEKETEILCGNNFIWIAYCKNHGAFIDKNDSFMCNQCGTFASSSTGVLNLTKEDIERYLTSQGYSNIEITYALNKINYDDSFFEYAINKREWMATYSLEKFIDNAVTHPTKEESELQLTQWEYTTEEIKVALSKFYKIFTPPTISCGEWVSLNELKNKAGYYIKEGNGKIIISDLNNDEIEFILTGLPRAISRNEIYDLEYNGITVQFQSSGNSNAIYDNFKLKYSDLVKIGVLL